MKNALLAISIIFSCAIHAQSISEHFGGLKTDFTIYFLGDKVEIQDQHIVKRGHSHTGFYGDASAGYGYGLQSLRLEFITPNRLNPNNSKRRFFYRFNFYDKDHNRLVTFRLYHSVLISRPGAINIYSLDLQLVPLILLDQVEEIWIQLEE